MRPCCILGNSTIDHVKRFSDFGQNFNVLCTTDVAEEGFDISKICKLVISFDPSENRKIFRQRRERAIAAGAKMIYLSPDGTSGLKELQHLPNQEKITNRCSGHKGLVNTAILGLLVENTISFKIDREIKNDPIFIANELEDKNSGDCSDNEDSKVNITSSTQLLTQYCQQLPSQETYKPKPLYWTEKAKNDAGYQCSILLPIYAPPSVRCIIGKYVLFTIY